MCRCFESLNPCACAVLVALKIPLACGACRRARSAICFLFLRDTLKTKEKCVKAAAESLSAGHSVVVDNTNPSAEVRALYVALARKNSPPLSVRCFHFVTAEEVAKHLNYFREVRITNAHLLALC